MRFLLVLNFGPTEMVILLVIVLIVFGGSRLPHLLRAMRNGLNFRRPDEAWPFAEEQPSESAESPQFNHPLVATIVILCAAVWLLLTAIEGELTMKQTLIGWGVLSIWAIVWWLCFGKSKE